MRPTIAVLITYHNEGDLLRECIESIINSSEMPQEIIVYDDSSRFPAQDYIPPEAGVRIIRSHLHRGNIYGRNLILDASNSDYVHFHDGDDLFTPSWCKRIRQAIEESRADVILTEVSAFEGVKLLSKCLLGVKRLLSGEDLVRFCLKGAIVPIATTIRREVANKIRYLEAASHQSEDFYYHIRLAASGASFNIINEPLVSKRRRPDSQSHDTVAVWADAVEMLKLLSKQLPARYNLDLAEALARSGRFLFRAGAFAKAKEAFRLADKLGPPRLSEQRKSYRLIAGKLGPEVAERMGVFYRAILPEKLRLYIVRRGW